MMIAAEYLRVSLNYDPVPGAGPNLSLERIEAIKGA